MKNLFLALAACSMAVSCVLNFSDNDGVHITGGCTEEGIDYSEVREVGPFSAISCGLPCNVYYVQAEAQEVRVETTREFVDTVLTTVQDGMLSIKLQEGHYDHPVLRVIVESPDIESIHISGNGHLIHEGTLYSTLNLNLRISGSGSIRTGDIVSDGFTGKCSGSGFLQTGNITCNRFSATVSGSGSVQVGGLSTEGYVTVRTSGSGTIRLDQVSVGRDMELKTSGSGGIQVNGNCRNVSASVSGSGHISGNLSYDTLQTSGSGSGRVAL